MAIARTVLSSVAVAALLLGFFLTTPGIATAQTVIATVPLPYNTCCAVAVNPNINKIYVSGGSSGGQKVAVIDGGNPSYPIIATMPGSDAGVDLLRPG